MSNNFTIKDSGHRAEFDSGSVRDTEDGKGRYDLLPPEALRRIAVHFQKGAEKYEDRNWEKGQPFSRTTSSMIRHGFDFLQGKRDEDHLAAVAWNAMVMMTMEERGRTDLNNLPWAGTVRKGDVLEEGLGCRVVACAAEQIRKGEVVRFVAASGSENKQSADYEKLPRFVVDRTFHDKVAKDALDILHQELRPANQEDEYDQAARLQAFNGDIDGTAAGINNRALYLRTTAWERGRFHAAVYVAGPASDVSLERVKANHDAAQVLAERLWKLEYAVICPHTNTSFLHGKSHALCLRGDLTLIGQMDAVVVLPGYLGSKGTQVEIEFARRHGIPVILPEEYEGLDDSELTRLLDRRIAEIAD